MWILYLTCNFLCDFNTHSTGAAATNDFVLCHWQDVAFNTY